MIARPKADAEMLFFKRLDDGCLIYLHHQQKWEVQPDGNMVKLKRKNIIVKISKDEFNKTFKVVEV